MYRTKEEVGWDNRNAANFAGGRKEGKKEVALEMLKRGINIDIVAECCKLSIQEIEVLKCSTADFVGGRKEGLGQAKKEVALEMKQDSANVESIIKYTKLSREQIETL